MKIRAIIMFLATAFFAPLAILAATGDQAAADPASLGPAWAALITVLTPFIVQAVKWLTPKIPTWLLPILAALVGIMLSFPATYLTGVEVSWWKSLLLALAGVGLREMGSNFTKPAKSVEENAAVPSYGQESP